MDLVFNVDPGIVAMAILLSQLVGRAIPDTATGFVGWIRRAAKAVGLYLENQK